MKSALGWQLRETEFKASLTQGDFVWQIKARQPARPDQLDESDLLRLHVVVEQAATNLAPPTGSLRQLHRIGEKIIFQWTSAAAVSKQIFEITDQPDFRVLLNKQELQNQSSLELGLKTGTYYWRILSQFNTDPPIATPAISLQIQSETSSRTLAEARPASPKPIPQMGLPPPAFIPPAGNLRADASGHLQLKWQAVPGATEYLVRLRDAQGKELRALHVRGTQTSLSELLPGNYQADLTAIGPHKQKSKSSTNRQVVVPDGRLEAPHVMKVEVQ